MRAAESEKASRCAWPQRGYDLAISYASKKEEAEKVAEQIRETYHTRCLIYQAALQEKGAGKALS